MVKLFLKDENDNIICKTKILIKDSYTVDVKSSVNIIFYSKRLLELDKKLQRRFIEDINELIEIKDWYLDYFVNSNKITRTSTMEEKMKLLEDELVDIYKNMAAKYGLTTKFDKGL